MKIYRGLDGLPAFENVAVTLGTFDGVHLGHKKIINRLLQIAKENDGESVLLTFWPHPRMVLYPDDKSLKLLNTIEERINLLKATGIDHLIILPFTFEFSRMTYLDFVRDILIDKIHTRALIVGYDHHFGRNREGAFEQLQECSHLYDFYLEQVRAFIFEDIPISSSKIRTALIQNEIKKANLFLGYSYFVEGIVVKGWQKGRELGFPTANVEIQESYKQLPELGIYIVRVNIEGNIYNGMASLGNNPTFENKGKTLEVNIFDFNTEIYGQKISVHFLDFLRKEVKFALSSELVEQMYADKHKALEYFADL